jgi:hypothetical protein
MKPSLFITLKIKHRQFLFIFEQFRYLLHSPAKLSPQRKYFGRFDINFWSENTQNSKDYTANLSFNCAFKKINFIF